MRAERLFLVSCRRCRLPVALAIRVGAAELDALLAHVRACEPDKHLGPAPGVDAILRHFDVRATEQGVV